MSVPTNAGSFPQEGDGKASGTGATPAVSVATMDFTSATAAAGASFAVHGATLTCVASGAGTTQFNAGSGSTLAANLASAINAATAVPTVTTGGIASPYLKALVWASASGAGLTVYSRIASVDLNQSVNASCTLICGATANWTNPPATANFSGGVSGPWGLFYNRTALTAGVSAAISAAGAYGAFVATLMGLPVAGDVLHVRTGRAGANIVILLSAATTVTGRAIGAATNYYEIRFDNGVVWNDGASNGVFTINNDTSGATMSLTFNGYVHVRGQMQSGATVQNGGVCNFKFTKTATETGSGSGSIYPTSQHGLKHTVLESVEFHDAGFGTATGAMWVFAASVSPISNPYQPIRLINCKFVLPRSVGGLFAPAGSYGVTVDAVDCLFSYGGAVQYTGALMSSAPTGVTALRLIRPKFTGGGGGHHILVAAIAALAAPSAVLYIEDPVDMGQFLISDSAASFCGRVMGYTSASVGCEGMAVGQFLTSSNGSRDFIFDTPRRLLEWRGGASFPTTGLSTLPDGTPFSIRFSVPHTGLASGLVTPWAPSRAIKQIATNTLGDRASLTATLHLLIDSTYGGTSYTPTDAEWWVEGTYVSSIDGSTKVFNTRGSGTALSADTQSWSTTTAFGPFGGAPRTYSKWKIQPVLTDVKGGSDISLYLVCGKQPSSMTEWCFIDPEFTLA